MKPLSYFGFLSIACLVTMAYSQGYLRPARFHPMSKVLGQRKHVSREPTGNAQKTLASPNPFAVLRRQNIKGDMNDIEARKRFLNVLAQDQTLMEQYLPYFSYFYFLTTNKRTKKLDK